jgi:hypothetical protein
VNDDFIVNDDGFGYNDRGGEMWEHDEEEEDVGRVKKNKRQKKVDVILNIYS